MGQKVVSIKMGKTEGSDVDQANAGAVEAFGKRARANARINEQHSGGGADNRCISGRAAGKDAEFQGHRSYRPVARAQCYAVSPEVKGLSGCEHTHALSVGEALGPAILSPQYLLMDLGDEPI